MVGGGQPVGVLLEDGLDGVLEDVLNGVLECVLEGFLVCDGGEGVDGWGFRSNL